MHRRTQTQKTAEMTRANFRAPGLMARADSVLLQVRACNRELKSLADESRELRKQIRQEIQDLQVERMRSWVLLSKIKLHCLEGSEVCSVFETPQDGSKPKPYGHRIQ